MAESYVPYEVGYGKPPRESRFQRGNSGNPRGRPKGSKNLATIVLRESRRRVRINGSRGSRTVTKLEAAMIQLGNKSAQGDLRATRDFLALVQRSEESATSGGSSNSFTELDNQTIENLRRRMQSIQPDGEQSQKEILK
jgi:hypothetical protein